jgi:DNA-binding MarR family transcriptional regulator
MIIEFYEKLSSWEQSVVAESGLTLPQMHTIEILGGNNLIKMKDLATKMGITTGTLTVMIDNLGKKGLVEVSKIPKTGALM